MKRLLFAASVAVVAAIAVSPVLAATFTWVAIEAELFGPTRHLPDGGGTIEADYLGGDQYLATGITGTFAGQPITGLAHNIGVFSIDDMLVPMTPLQGIAFYTDNGTSDGFLYQIFNTISKDPRAPFPAIDPTAGPFSFYAVDPITLDEGANGGLGRLRFGVILVTPIPGALPLFATGLAGLGWLARRRRKHAA